MLDLIFILLEEGVLRVLVNTRFIFDSFGAGSVPESTDRLFVIIVGGGARGDHHCFGVATKRVLEETCQLRCTIRDVLGFTIDKTRYHIS